MNRQVGLWISATALGFFFWTYSRPAAAFRSGGDLADLNNQTVVAFATGEIDLELSDQLSPADLDPAVVELNLEEAMNAWNAPGCAALARLRLRRRRLGLRQRHQARVGLPGRREARRAVDGS